MPASAATLPKPGADDVPGALACPKCRASVRPDQAWCTLCLTPFRAAAPEPEPLPVTAPVAEATAPVAEATATTADPARLSAGPTADPTAESATEGRSAVDQAEIERRADELLAQLAADPTLNPPTLPPFLSTKARRMLAMVVGAVAFALITVAGLTLLGVVFR